MFIWGLRRRQKTVGRGTFFCPRCNQNRRYKLKRDGYYFSIFFVPLLRLKKLGEYVECQVCKNTYEPQVLASSSQDTLKLVASTRYALLHGTHPTEARSLLMDRGADAGTADRIIEMAQR